MGFDEAVLASLSEIAMEAARPTVAATEAEVVEAARRMATTGYDFKRTSNALVALRHYLNGHSLFIGGNAGTGKTMFFRSLADSGVARHGVYVYSLGEHGNDYEREVVDEIRAHNGDEVVVDDVGCESDWNGRRDADMLFRILAVREGLRFRTHLTSNADKARLQGYDERVRSRLKAFEFVPFVGADNRATCVNAEEMALRRKCACRASWILCEDRCACFRDGVCCRGVAVPPALDWQGRRVFPPEECLYFVPIVAARLGRDGVEGGGGSASGEVVSSPSIEEVKA